MLAHYSSSHARRASAKAGFLRQATCDRACFAARSATAAGVINPRAAVEYVKKQPGLVQLLGGPQAHIVAEELHGGKINYVFKITGQSTAPDSSAAAPTPVSVLLKYCPPYVKAFREGEFPLTQERLHVEAGALQLVHRHCPQHTPDLLLYDEQQRVVVMQYLPARVKLLAALHSYGLVLPQLSSQLSQLLASYLFHTSRAALSEGEMCALCARFQNREVVAVNESVVLTSAFDPNCPTNHWLPELDDVVAEMRSDPDVCTAHAELVAAYRQQRQAVIHNDLHIGNLLVDLLDTPSLAPEPGAPGAVVPEHGQPEQPLVQPGGTAAGAAGAAGGSLHLIDWEFATVGPVAFDVGSLLGNLLLAYFTQRAALLPCAEGESDDTAPAACADQQQQQQLQWLLHTVELTWMGFCEKFQSLCVQHQARASTAPCAGGQASSSTMACGAYGAGNEPAGSATNRGSGASSTSGRDQRGHMDLDLGALERQALGFAAVCMVRLIIGVHHYPGMEGLKGQARQAACGRACLKLATWVLREVNRRSGSDPQGRLTVREVVQRASELGLGA